MLAGSERYRCVECGRQYGADGFHYHKGLIENGAAYWSDRGLLCSPRCSLAHVSKRRAGGTLADKPAPDPLDRR